MDDWTLDTLDNTPLGVSMVISKPPVALAKLEGGEVVELRPRAAS